MKRAAGEWYSGLDYRRKGARCAVRLHHVFHALTAMRPLRYQKQLWLHVARERMLNEGLDAARAACGVRCGGREAVWP